MDSGVGAAGAFHFHFGAFYFGENGFEDGLDGRQAGLDLPAVIIGAVVAEGDADASHGCSTAPCGQRLARRLIPCPKNIDGGQVREPAPLGGPSISLMRWGGSRVFLPGCLPGIRGRNRRATRLLPPSLARLGDAQIGSAAAAVDDGAGSQHLTPADCRVSITSRVLPPVVTTSSITTAVSSGMDGKAAAENHFTGCGVAFGEQESGAQGSGDFVADDQASDGGRNHDVAFREVRGELTAEFFGDRGVLKDQGALHVLVGMKAAVSRK